MLRGIIFRIAQVNKQTIARTKLLQLWIKTCRYGFFFLEYKLNDSFIINAKCDKDYELDGQRITNWTGKEITNWTGKELRIGRAKSIGRAKNELDGQRTNWTGKERIGRAKTRTLHRSFNYVKLRTYSTVLHTNGTGMNLTSKNLPNLR
jgi:hypothetical protein